MPLTPSLESLSRCLQGLIPSTVATCAADGTPNITYLSHVQYVDPTHIALSCQFFNKTRRNVRENPHACLQLYDPTTLEVFRLQLRYERSETEGPLFDLMSLRIQAIASVTGMSEVFRLQSSDVFEVQSIEKLEGFVALDPPSAPIGPEFALRHVLGVQIVSQQINRARTLDEVFSLLLTALDDACGFGNAMVMVPDEAGRKLVALATRGYGDQGIGAEVPFGEGVIGAVAEQRQLLRVSGLDGELRYGRAIRERVASTAGAQALNPEVPLPGLPGAAAQLALPLVVQDRLVGVLALESRDPLAFSTWDEALLQILGNQIALVLDRHAAQADEEVPAEPVAASPAPKVAAGARRRTFTFYRNDDCVFVDGEYLIRNVPGKIFWKLLTAYTREGRSEFTNRELRLDPTLGLPGLRSNLESRLILLRKRLEQQCPDVRLVPVRRGRFALHVACPVELTERETG